MITKILENARQIFFLSLAIFFLMAAGLLLRMFWLEEPIQALGKRLLAKDGALLISILSDRKMIQAVRAIAAPTKDAAKTKPAGQYLIDALLHQDAKLLKEISTHLLKQPGIQALLKPAKPDKGPSSLERLGQHALDRLLAQDAKAATTLLKGVLVTLLTAAPKPKSATSSSPWKSLERLGKYALDRLLQRRGELAIRLSTQILRAVQSKQTSPSAGPTPMLHADALLEKLGKHAIDRLTAGRAFPLRAMLQDLLGPEPMRTMRALRKISQSLSNQLTQIHINELVREAAYQLGRGGLEAFLKDQQRQQQQKLRQRRKLRRLRMLLPQTLRTRFTCLLPRGERWLTMKEGGYSAQVRYLSHRKICDFKRCLKTQKNLRRWLQQTLQLHHPEDLQILQSPTCQELMATTKQKEQRKPLHSRSRPKPSPTPRLAPTRSHSPHFRANAKKGK